MGGLLKPRYWWGGKALYAIGLNWLSVPECRHFIEIATYGAWLAFAAALALHGLPALAAAFPLTVFGIAYSGVPYFSDASNGPGYLLAVAAAALFALSLRWRATSRLSQPLCFAAGMVSCYLWLFDSHNFLAVALIGLVHWLTALKWGDSGAPRAVGSMALYAAGFIAIFALGQTTKIVAYDRVGEPHGLTGEFVVQGLTDNTAKHLRRTVSPQGRDRVDMDVEVFAALTPEVSGRQAEIIFKLSGLALGIAMAAGLLMARRRGEFAAVRTCAWFIALMLAAGILFILPNDIPSRSARYLFLFPALCLSCAAVVAQMLWGARGSLAAAACAVVLAVWPMSTVVAKQIANGKEIESVLERATPLPSTGFDLYLDGTAMLIYVEDSCSEIDWGSMFYLHVYPFDASNLRTDSERRKGRKTVDFEFFAADFALQDGRRCVAAQRLPDYPVRIIETGQFGKNRGKTWGVKIEFERSSGELPTTSVIPPAELWTGGFGNAAHPTEAELARISHSF